MDFCSILRAAEPTPAAASAEARLCWERREVEDLGLGKGWCVHRVGKFSAEGGNSKAWDFGVPGWAGVKGSAGRSYICVVFKKAGRGGGRCYKYLRGGGANEGRELPAAPRRGGPAAALPAGGPRGREVVFRLGGVFRRALLEVTAAERWGHPLRVGRFRAGTPPRLEGSPRVSIGAADPASPFAGGGLKGCNWAGSSPSPAVILHLPGVQRVVPPFGMLRRASSSGAGLRRDASGSLAAAGGVSSPRRLRGPPRSPSPRVQDAAVG